MLRYVQLNCKGVIRELSNFIDGVLDADVKHELERHLENCEDCKLTVDQTRKTIEIFCGSEPASLPADLLSRLHAALRQKTIQKPT